MAKRQDDPQENQTDATLLSNLDLNKVGDELWDALFHMPYEDFEEALHKVLKVEFKPKSLEFMAGKWIFFALRNACDELLEKNFPEQHKTLKKHHRSPMYDPAKLKQSFCHLAIPINLDFFNSLQGVSFIWPFQDIFKDLLIALGVDEKEAFTNAHILPRSFMAMIAHQWEVGKREKSGILKTIIEEDLKKVLFRRLQQIPYYQDLAAEFYSYIMGDEDLRLSDLYIEPGFKVYKSCFLEKNEEEFDREGFTKVKFKGSLHDYINNHFLKGDSKLKLKESEDSQFLILLGQPGQGKSSFCLKTCHALINNTSFDKDLVFVRLKNLINSKNFLADPLAELKVIIQDYEYDLKNTVLILDGLDELYMGQNLAKDGMKYLLFQLGKILDSYKGLYLILTSRYNYIDLDQFRRNNALILNLDTLSFKQQKEWLRNYKKKKPKCKLTQKIIKEVNDEENEGKYSHIKELINQPILLQLVATSGLDVRNANNRAEIYNRLFEAVINRSWDGGQLTKYQKLQNSPYGKEDYRDYLRTIALRIYQSEFEYIHRQELSEMPETRQFQKKYLEEYSDPGMVLKDILVSFYFKSVDPFAEDTQKGRQKANAIEFYHKSLQEYLAAEKIWNEIAEQFSDKGRRNFKLTKWHDALKIIYELVSPKPLSQEVTQYLIEIIENDKTYNKEDLRYQMASFLPDLLDRQFLYEYRATEDGFNPLQKAAGCFHAYWTILSHIRGDQQIIRQDFNKPFCNVLRMFSHIPIFFHFNLSSTNLSSANLSSAKLNRANLSSVDLSYAKLFGTDLSHADLSHADLSRANLSRADLFGVNLSRANLSRAKLINANLSRANLSSTYLFDAKLSSAYLSRADLSRADLSRADLSRADLSRVNLSRANLRSANLRSANLSRANLAEVRNLSAEQLSQVGTLHECKGIPQDIEQSLRKSHPSLFKKPIRFTKFDSSFEEEE